MSEHVYKPGERVTWLQSCTWGGKQNVVAEFVRYSGDKSARIKTFYEKRPERTVRLAWLRPATGSNSDD